LANIGKLGEKVVGQWLEDRGYEIFHHRWRCSWGEIDLIAQDKVEKTLVFVEVKTRSQFNWDVNGLLSVNGIKQKRLWHSSQVFFAENSKFINFNCRFDLALAIYFPLDKNRKLNKLENKPVFQESGYQFILQDYLQDALDFSDF
jgi:putative endonuclease